MKKFAMLSLAVAALVLPTVASADDAKPAAAPAAAAPAMAAAKKVELKDGSWAQVAGDSVTVSKDGGKTWTPAPDGTWEAKDGSKLVTKGGKVAK